MFLNFCEIFWKRLLENPNSIEQGIANYMFSYEKLFNDVIIKSDNYGPVMTIGKTEPHNIILDSQNNILNFGREIAAVVHQYDRKKDIVQKVIQKYCPEILNSSNITIQNSKIDNKTINDINGENFINSISSIKKGIDNINYKNTFLIKLNPINKIIINIFMLSQIFIAILLLKNLFYLKYLYKIFIKQ